MSKLQELNKTRLNWVVILLVVSTLDIFFETWHGLYLHLTYGGPLLDFKPHPSWVSYDPGWLTDYLVLGLPNSLSFLISALIEKFTPYQSLIGNWYFAWDMVMSIAISYPLAFLIGKWLSRINAQRGLWVSLLAYVIASLMSFVVSGYIFWHFLFMTGR